MRCPLASRVMQKLQSPAQPWAIGIIPTRGFSLLLGNSNLHLPSFILTNLSPFSTALTAFTISSTFIPRNENSGNFSVILGSAEGRQPVTITFLPLNLSNLFRIFLSVGVFTVHVLTIRIPLSPNSKPFSARSPAIASESALFIAHPYVSIWIFIP